MKIQKIKTPSTGAVKADKVRAKGKNAATRAVDRVEMTGLASQVKTLEASLAKVEVVDTQRVDQIKREISEGRFRVDPEVVADRLVAAVKDLVLSRKDR